MLITADTSFHYDETPMKDSEIPTDAGPETSSADGSVVEFQTTWSGEERRSSRRYDTNSKANWQFDCVSSLVEVRDISRTGALIYTNSAVTPKVGQTIKLLLNSGITVSARIVWNSDYFFGVQFNTPLVIFEDHNLDAKEGAAAERAILVFETMRD